MGSIQWREPPGDRPNRRAGEMVEFGGRRDAGRGYMARSDRVGPCVIVLHEFFGLQQSFKDFADRLNEDGFTVLVPDLYDGRIAPTVEDARSLARSLDAEATLSKLGAAADFLTANWHPRLGLVGFSLGADFAVELAPRRSVEAIVLYYGVGELETSPWRGPTLGHFGASDEWVPRAEAEQAFTALEERGGEADLNVYPNTGHWFGNPNVPDAYDEGAATAAFEATCDFLHHHLA